MLDSWNARRPRTVPSRRDTNRLSCNKREDSGMSKNQALFTVVKTCSCGSCKVWYQNVPNLKLRHQVSSHVWISNRIVGILAHSGCVISFHRYITHSNTCLKTPTGSLKVNHFSFMPQTCSYSRTFHRPDLIVLCPYHLCVERDYTYIPFRPLQSSLIFSSHLKRQSTEPIHQYLIPALVLPDHHNVQVHCAVFCHFNTQVTPN